MLSNGAIAACFGDRMHGSRLDQFQGQFERVRAHVSAKCGSLSEPGIDRNQEEQIVRISISREPHFETASSLLKCTAKSHLTSFSVFCVVYTMTWQMKVASRR